MRKTLSALILLATMAMPAIAQDDTKPHIYLGGSYSFLNDSSTSALGSEVLTDPSAGLNFSIGVENHAWRYGFELDSFKVAGSVPGSPTLGLNAKNTGYLFSFTHMIPSGVYRNSAWYIGGGVGWHETKGTASIPGLTTSGEATGLMTLFRAGIEWKNEGHVLSVGYKHVWTDDLNFGGVSVDPIDAGGLEIGWRILF